MDSNHRLRVFLCHASQDKHEVRVLYNRLKTEEWIDPWLDEEKILPGQDWDLEIKKAIRKADVIIVCLSTVSVAKEGYVQKEIKRVLDLSEEKPEGAIYIIPLRLDDCTPPIRFQQWQWLDYFSDDAYSRLLKSLVYRMEVISANKKISTFSIQKNIIFNNQSSKDFREGIEFCKFIKIDAEPTPNIFWAGKYPITNFQYNRFLSASDFLDIEFWKNLPLFDRTTQTWTSWDTDGLEWLEENVKKRNLKEGLKSSVRPTFWNDPNLGVENRDNPVVGITWWEANAYCKWLQKHWLELPEARANPKLQPHTIRLPSNIEWIATAGGDSPINRYPWDTRHDVTTSIEEITIRANIQESRIGHTTPVDNYPHGASSYGVMDMLGNVREWLAETENAKYSTVALKSSSWADNGKSFHITGCHIGIYPIESNPWCGFRVIALPDDKFSS